MKPTPIRSPTPDEVFGIRFNAKLTQKQAGALIGSPSGRAWQDWESGHRNMPWAKFRLFVLLTSKS